MKLEILESILSIYKYKQPVLQYYLSDDVNEIISSSMLYDPMIDELYPGTKLYLIDKSTLQIDYTGKLMNIHEDKIHIKIKNKYTLKIPSEDYYVFFEKYRTKKSQKDLYQSLLQL